MKQKKIITAVAVNSYTSSYVESEIRSLHGNSNMVWKCFLVTEPGVISLQTHQSQRNPWLGLSLFGWIGKWISGYVDAQICIFKRENGYFFQPCLEFLMANPNFQEQVVIESTEPLDYILNHKNNNNIFWSLAGLEMYVNIYQMNTNTSHMSLFLFIVFLFMLGAVVCPSCQCLSDTNFVKM